MSKIMSLIRRAPKRLSAIAMMVAAAIIVPLAVNAWGPNRDTYTIEKPADHVVFNSITNNPAHGDERNFVQIKEAGASDSTYKDAISLTPGKQYTMFVYYHNNAATNLNASGKGIATGAYMKAQLPAIVAKGSAGTKANGFVGAANANPGEVWDDVSLSNPSTGDIAIRYISGSAKMHNRGALNGSTIADSIITTGAPIGYDKPGIIPGCNEYSGYVTFNFVADQANFEVSKEVRLAGTTEWKESVQANPGATVEYLIGYKNSGTTQQNNVVLKDTLPQGVTYVNGSSKLTNASNPTSKVVSDNLVATSGINIGNYTPGSNAYLKFSAKVSSNKEDFCSPKTLKNVARAETNNGSKQDTADVTVPAQDCKPPVVVKYTCDNLKVVTVDRTHFKFSTTYTQQNATFKSATYVIKNAAGTTVDTKTVNGTTNLDYTQPTVGKYTVQSTLTFTVNGTTKTVTSNGCKGAFEVPKLPEHPGVSIEKTVNGKKAVQVAVNAPFTYELKVKNTGDVALTNVKVTDPAPANVEFLKADVGTIANNAWSYTIPSLKVGETKSFKITAKVTKEVSGAIKNTACVDAPAVPGNPDDCDTATVTVPPAGEITVCELATKQIITIKENAFDAAKHSKNLDDCKETPTTPETPPELPHTGIGENIVAIVGLGALVASLGYYIASRRALS